VGLKGSAKALLMDFGGIICHNPTSAVYSLRGLSPKVLKKFNLLAHFAQTLALRRRHAATAHKFFGVTRQKRHFCLRFGGRSRTKVA